MGGVTTEVSVATDEEGGGPRVEVVMPERTAAQREREAQWDAAMEEAFGAQGKEIPEALWMAFGAGTDRQRLAKGVTVAQYGRVGWQGYSRHYTTLDGETLSLGHGVSLPWPNHGNGKEPGLRRSSLRARRAPCVRRTSPPTRCARARRSGPSRARGRSPVRSTARS